MSSGGTPSERHAGLGLAEECGDTIHTVGAEEGGVTQAGMPRGLGTRASSCLRPRPGGVWADPAALPSPSPPTPPHLFHLLLPMVGSMPQFTLYPQGHNRPFSADAALS